MTSNPIDVLRKSMPGLNVMTERPRPLCTSTCLPWWGTRALPELVYIDTLIVHLNDVHCWTRERIADWLESLDVDLTFGVKS